MLSAISYAFREQETPAAARSVAAAGLTHIELWRGHPGGLAECAGPEAPETVAARLKADLAGAGVAVSAYCVGGITDESPAQIERWGRIALGLGTDILTGCLLRPERAAEINGILSAIGVRYAIENHKGIHFEGLAPYQALFAGDRYPQLGINVDTGHFILAEVDPAQAVARMGARVFHVHLKDVPKPGDKRYHHSCPIGHGRLDVPAVLEALAGIGYAGPISIEYEDQDPLPALKSSLQYLRGRL
ncbi:MAG TPA: sugar phosphate isomerase/epimerase [Limnochordia bacterium]|nr:sugar phosphate isomerase/epimerase [Limnochordia bacterium]